MRLTFQHELAFVTATLEYGGATVEVPNVLVDTGAASTVLNADVAAEVGLHWRPGDPIRRLRGVGGYEHVFVRRVGRLSPGEHGLTDFELEIGEMDYGFDLGGILGMDFLRAGGAIIDLRRDLLELERSSFEMG